MATSPIFAVGSYSKILAAIAANKLTYPAYIWVRDESNAEMNNKYLFLDSDNNLREVVGNNPKSVEKVDVLPEVANAKEDVLYIYNNKVYLLVDDSTVESGKSFKLLYQDVSDQVSDIDTRLKVVESVITGDDETDGLETKVTDLETKVAALEAGTTSGGVQWIDLDTESEDTEQTT